MPHKGGKRRSTPRKTYAQKAQRKAVPNSSKKNGDPKVDRSTLSLFEVARNTEQRRSWNKSLRHTHVQFVSASDAIGTSREVQVDNNEDNQSSQIAPVEGDLEDIHGPADPRHQFVGTQADSTPRQSGNLTTELDSSHVPSKGSADVKRETRLRTLKSEDVEDSLRFHIDSVGSSSLPEGRLLELSPAQAERVENDSDNGEADDDDDDDVVVFAGRRVQNRAYPNAKTTASGVDLVEENIRLVSLDGSQVGSKDRHKLEILNSSVELEEGVATEADSLTNEVRPQIVSPQELAAEDYIANLYAYHSQSNEEDQVSDTEGQETTVIAPEGVGTSSHLNDSDASCEGSTSNASCAERPLRGSAALPRGTAMTDEELAYRLAKQEEFGLGSSDLLLWQDEDILMPSTDEAEHDLDDTAGHEFTEWTKSLRKQPHKTLGYPRSHKHLNEDEIFEEIGYGNFDIMDFERPSLQRKAKHGPKSLPFHLSDSELEATMISSWENDRAKKRHRKQQREVQRLEANMLTAVEGFASADASIDLYDALMGEVGNRLMSFLESDSTSLTLAPMNKRYRKVIHDVANSLDLRSKSKGSGAQRYPCLYKTSQTKGFDRRSFDTILKRHGMYKFMGRHDVRNFKTLNKSSIAKSNGGASSRVTYRDGETVGGSAPALGSENRGHTLLSKMGWSSGMALGARDNKGSLEPVSHKVRASRAGLG